MIGKMIRDRYRLDEEIGRGGLGAVYQAQDTVLQRDVAVKVLAETTVQPTGITDNSDLTSPSEQWSSEVHRN
jgi:serine/threonine protein kinase